MSHPKAMRKKGFYRNQYKIGLPYPNFGIRRDQLPLLCRCFMEGYNFYVTHQQDIPTLYRDGSFGYSNVTLRGPTSLLEGSHETSRYFQKYKSRRATEDVRESSDLKRRLGIDDKSELRDENSKSVDFVTPDKRNGVDEVEEKLILLPEEVIFLSFGVGCLSIQKSVSLDQMTYEEVWKSLVQENEEFPYFYAVYHFFRSKNWVPKAGHQYGGDYVLYQVGPEFYHSTYVVHILGLPSRPRLTWLELHALERVAVSVNKHVLLCEVTPPKGFVVSNSTPRCIFDMEIRETVISRWTPYGRSESQQEDC